MFGAWRTVVYSDIIVQISKYTYPCVKILAFVICTPNKAKSCENVQKWPINHDVIFINVNYSSQFYLCGNCYDVHFAKHLHRNELHPYGNIYYQTMYDFEMSSARCAFSTLHGIVIMSSHDLEIQCSWNPHGCWLAEGPMYTLMI